MIQRQRGGASVDVARHVRLHHHDEVRPDDAAAGDGGAARVHHDAHAAGLGPARHLGGDVGVLDAGDTYLADQLDARGGHLFEVGLGETGFQQSTAPACTLTPDGRSFANDAWARIARAFTPAGSVGRPGVCGSPAESIVVVPPCR